MSEYKIKAYREDCLMCCPSTKVIKSDSKVFLAIDELHEDKLCDTSQAMAPTNVETVHQTSLPHVESNPIDSDCCRLSTAIILSNKADKPRPDEF